MGNKSTQNFDIPLPDPASQLRHDVLRLIAALEKVDAELQTLTSQKANNTKVNELESAQQSTAQSLVQTKAEIEQQLARKQAVLVSGSNIKTIGGLSLLGEGDIQNGLVVQRVTANTIAQVGVHYELATAGTTLTMPDAEALKDGDEIGFTNTSAGDVNINWQGAKVKGVVPDAAFTVPSQGTAKVIYSKTGATWL